MKAIGAITDFAEFLEIAVDEYPKIFEYLNTDVEKSAIGLSDASLLRLAFGIRN